MAESLPNPAEAWANAFRTITDMWTAVTPNMAATAGADPFQTWQKAYDQWLSGLTSTLEQNLSRPETAAAGGKTLDAMLNVEKPLREQTAAMMQFWLEFMNMPSRRDLLRALTSLNDANARLDELQAQVEMLSDKFDALLDRLDSAPAVRDTVKGATV